MAGQRNERLAFLCAGLFTREPSYDTVETLAVFVGIAEAHPLCHGGDQLVGYVLDGDTVGARRGVLETQKGRGDLLVALPPPFLGHSQSDPEGLFPVGRGEDPTQVCPKLLTLGE